MDARFAILLVVASLLQLALFGHSGRFLRPRWKAYGKIGFSLLIAGILANALGWWSLVWFVGHPALDLWAHAFWCRNNGIDWLTCEPRGRYMRLRPWAVPEQAVGSDAPLTASVGPFEGTHHG
ncbi:MAG: hypothetical protein WD031_02935 [Gemmatimonadota bacterium]